VLVRDIKTIDNLSQNFFKAGSKPVLCLDFDGVLHRFKDGWQGPEVIPDTPVRGAQVFVSKCRQHFQVIVHSARAKYPGGAEAIQRWLKKWRFPEVEVQATKPAAFLTLDDRAERFDGLWPDPKKLLRFRTWQEARGAKKGVHKALKAERRAAAANPETRRLVGAVKPGDRRKGRKVKKWKRHTHPFKISETPGGYQ
jgi:hypothetical protein